MAWHVADGTKHDKPLHEHSHHHPCWTDTCTNFPCEPVQTGHPLPQQHKVAQPGLPTPTTSNECVPIFDIRATAGYWNLDDLRDEDFPDFQVYSDAPLHGLKRFLEGTKPKGDKRQKSLTWNYVEFPWTQVHVFRDVQLFERLQCCDDFQVFSAHCECPPLTKIWIPSHCKFQLALIHRALLKSCKLNISGNHRQHVHHGICMDQIWLSTESLVFLQQADQITELRLFVPFCGGISGWTFASRWMCTHGVPIRSAFAIDLDPVACKFYAENHGHQFIQEPLTPELLADIPAVVCADVGQKDVWMAASLMGCNAITLSWPCVTFSHAGNQAGWNTPGGWALKDALGYATNMQIRWLLLENVPPVWEKAEFKIPLLDLLVQHGFALKFARVLQCDAIVPSSRRRFMALAVSAGEKGQLSDSDIACIRMAFASPPIKLKDANAWFEETHIGLFGQLTLEQNILDQYTDVSRAPCPASTPEQVLQNRLVGPNQTIPGTTIMRSYTKQHNFRTGKILGNLRLDEWNMPRFFAPYELLVAMGITSGFVLPKDVEAASALIGNSVTEIHALAAIWALVQESGIQHDCRFSACCSGLPCGNAHSRTAAHRSRGTLPEVLHQDYPAGTLTSQNLRRGLW